MTLRPLETIRESVSSSPISVSINDAEQSLYTIIKIKGKGLGIVANNDIPPGRLIIEEKPLFSVPLTASGDLPGRYDATTQEFVSTTLIQSLSKLSDKELEDFYLLSDSVKDHQKSMKNPAAHAKQTTNTNPVKPNSRTQFQTIVQKIFTRNRNQSNSTSTSPIKVHKLPQRNSPNGVVNEKQKCDNKKPPESCTVKRKTNYGIMKTNSFNIEINVSKVVISPAQKRKIIKVNENRLALFPKISRLNHSCQPNCNHYWCGQAGKFMIRAIRPILKGEEITISYMSPLRRRGFTTGECRRRILYHEFGFLCCCDVCALGKMESWNPSSNDILSDDDKMRERVSEIETYWTASENENGPGDLQPTYLEAFVLSVEQLVLSQKLDFQAGIECYVILHNIEASSGLLEEIQKAKNNDFTTDMLKIVDTLHSWGSKVSFPVEQSWFQLQLREKKRDMIQNDVFVCLEQWLMALSELAVYHANIAYGQSSIEAKIFMDIASLWNNFSSYSNNEKSQTEDIDHPQSDCTKNHELVKKYISML